MIVLLSGWSGSGKDAAATLLTEEMNFTRLAFADLLKEDVSEKSGIPLSAFHDPAEKDTPINHMFPVTPRQLLLAHALRVRATDPDIYSRGVSELILALDHDRFIVSDWRYKREYEVLCEKLGPDANIVRGRIQRPGITVSDDPSEHDLDDESFDFTIANDGCISDLRDRLKSVIRLMLGRMNRLQLPDMDICGNIFTTATESRIE